MRVEWVKEPGTDAPDADKAFVAVAQPGGQAQWVELVTDAGDDVRPADLAFEEGKEWAQTQRGPE